jgi:hypothetical protein
MKFFIVIVLLSVSLIAEPLSFKKFGSFLDYINAKSNLNIILDKDLEDIAISVSLSKDKVVTQAYAYKIIQELIKLNKLGSKRIGKETMIISKNYFEKPPKVEKEEEYESYIYIGKVYPGTLNLYSFNGFKENKHLKNNYNYSLNLKDLVLALKNNCVDNVEEGDNSYRFKVISDCFYDYLVVDYTDYSEVTELGYYEDEFISTNIFEGYKSKYIKKYDVTEFANRYKDLKKLVIVEDTVPEVPELSNPSLGLPKLKLSENSMNKSEVLKPVIRSVSDNHKFVGTTKSGFTFK